MTGARRSRMSTRRRLMFSCLVLLLAPVLLESCATLLERALREKAPATGWGSDDPQFFVQDPVLGYRMRAGSEGRYSARTGQTLSYKINEIGCRDTPVTTSVFDVLFLGDSCTFGEGLEDGQPGYVDLLESRLEKKAGRDLEFLNAGVPGYCTTYGNRWYQGELSRAKFRAVVVWLGWNDRWWRHGSGMTEKESVQWLLNVVRESASYKLAARWLRGPMRRLHHRWITSASTTWTPLVPLQDTPANLREIIDRARSLGSRVILMTSPSGARELTDVPEYLVREKSLPDYATFLELVDVYNDIIRKVAREADTPLVDLDKGFASEPVRAYFTDPQRDAVHPDHRGHAKVAELLQPELEKALEIP